METVREASVKEVPREQRFHGLAGKLQGHFELLSRRLLDSETRFLDRDQRAWQLQERSLALVASADDGGQHGVALEPDPYLAADQCGGVDRRHDALHRVLLPHLAAAHRRARRRDLVSSLHPSGLGGALGSDGVHIHAVARDLAQNEPKRALEIHLKTNFLVSFVPAAAPLDHGTFGNTANLHLILPAELAEHAICHLLRLLEGVLLPKNHPRCDGSSSGPQKRQRRSTADSETACIATC
mmetsp:Transcript_40059/g.94998  ORF Transcript_40059/g.94998 Transcript_40059/m.94998 type:complete len:240 (+) Transcript_40059:380-1099(+)